MNESAQIKEIKCLAKNFGVKVYFNHYKFSSGFYRKSQESIHISLVKGKKHLLSTFFHELGHHHCNIVGIWKNYHNGLTGNKKFIKTAWKAEIWVEKWAENTMKSFYPKIKYYKTYNTDCSSYKKFIRRWFKKNILKK